MNINEFISDYSKKQQAIILRLHRDLIDLNLRSEYKFKLPFYYKRSWICYLNPTKQDTVELAFTRGNELSNAYDFLEKKGRRQVYGIEIINVKDCSMEGVISTIHEAILLDEKVPYASKRKRG